MGYHACCRCKVTGDLRVWTRVGGMVFGGSGKKHYRARGFCESRQAQSNGRPMQSPLIAAPMRLKVYSRSTVSGSLFLEPSS